jgi:AraC family transcriptional regulator, regulatory protein of adaptative response / methylated-DNA-[protein]-cysteine methyltransferase
MAVEVIELEEKAWKKLQRKPELCVGVRKSPWGLVMIGLVGGELAALCLVAPGKKEATAIAEFAANWPGVPSNGTIKRDHKVAAVVLDIAVAVWRGEKGARLRVLLKGTDFQRRIWRALLEIPHGQTTTYGELAKKAGCHGAARAVGQAVGSNPVAVLVPCHRVVASDGSLGGYAWGPARKRALLRAEGAIAE